MKIIKYIKRILFKNYIIDIPPNKYCPDCRKIIEFNCFTAYRTNIACQCWIPEYNEELRKLYANMEKETKQILDQYRNDTKTLLEKYRADLRKFMQEQKKLKGLAN